MQVAAELEAAEDGAMTELILLDVLTGSSRQQIEAVVAAYDALEDKSYDNLAALVEARLSGFWADMFGAKDLVFCCQMMLQAPVHVFCTLIKKAFEGMGTDKRLIMRVVGGSSQQTVSAIMSCYEQEKYGGADLGSFA